MIKHITRILTALTLSTLFIQAEIRTWTGFEGSTIEAEFVKLEGDRVYLKTAAGETKQIPKSKLIKEDQLLVAEMSSPFASKKAAAKKMEPQPAPQALLDLFGDELRNAEKDKIPTSALTGKTIGIYFSAHWCPPCRGFTPSLVEFHNEVTRAGNPFEIVFVSSDRDKASMYDYMEEMEMPWLALPFGDKHKGKLSEKYGVRGIPMLVIIDKDGNLITKNGRGEVSSKGADAFEQWK